MSFNRRKNHTARKIAVGSAIAGFAGYLAGILTAPKAGKETRADLRDRADELRENMIDQLHELNDELKVLLKMAKSRSSDLSSSAKAEFNEALVRAKDAQNKTSQVIKAFKNGEADEPELNKAAKQARQAIKNLNKYLKT